jgi:hypothetical protein
MSLFEGQTAVAGDNAEAQFVELSVAPDELFLWDRLCVSAFSHFHIETVPFGTENKFYVYSMISRA